MNPEDMKFFSNMMDEKLKANNTVIISLIQGLILPLHTEILDFKTEAAEHFARIEQRLDQLEEHMDQLDEHIDHLEHEVAHLKKDVQHLQIDVRKLQTYTENRVEPALCLLSENYVPAANRNRYEHDHTEMDAMRADIDLLNKTVARHSVELQRLAAQAQTAG